MQSFFSLLLIAFFSLFPVLLWGYGTNVLSSHEWNRTRFFSGMVGGGLSVLVIYFLRDYFSSEILYRICGVLGVFVIVWIFVWGATARGSDYVRVFLRKISLLHMGVFLVVYGFSEMIAWIFPIRDHILPILLVVFSAFLPAWIEESVKHLSGIGLTAREFRFSLRDLLVFSFFVTLGFVMVENFLYLMDAYHHGMISVFITGINRSIVALLAHMFSASICVILWWKALSYRVFSPQYVGVLLLGFIGAIMSHVVFNTIVLSGNILLLLLYTIGAYMFFTYWMSRDYDDAR